MVTENGENTKVRISIALHAHHIETDYMGLVDYILFIKADVDHTPNPNEVQDTKYASENELKIMLKNNTLTFTPWFKLICESMLYEWWEHLDEGLEEYEGEKSIRRM